MLSEKQIEKVRVKIVKDKINQSKLARKILCSNGTLTQIFQQTKDFPKVERRLLEWLNENKKVEN